MSHLKMIHNYLMGEKDVMKILPGIFSFKIAMFFLKRLGQGDFFQLEAKEMINISS